MRLVNAYAISPSDIQVGDVMLYTVKAMVLHEQDGKLRYRIYRCEWEGDEIPQGSPTINMEEVASALFPSLAMVAEPG